MRRSIQGWISKFCGSQPFKKFTQSVLEYFVRNDTIGDGVVEAFIIAVPLTPQFKPNIDYFFT